MKAHHVPVIGSCNLCHCVFDSTCHALFWCKKSKSFWKDTLFYTFLKDVRNLEIFDLFIWMEKMLSCSNLELFAMKTWAIWQEQMSIIHGVKLRISRMDVVWSDSLLSEFHTSRELLNISCDHRLIMSQIRWSKPIINQLRLAVDTALHEQSNSYSVGGAVRDHEGRLVMLLD